MDIRRPAPRLAFVVALAVAWLPPGTLEAQRLNGPEFPRTPPPAILFAASNASPQLQQQARGRRRMSCPRARVVGGVMGAIEGGLLGLVIGATTAIIPWPRESGTDKARAANRRMRLFTAGGAVVGATAGATLLVHCDGS